jgi:hypothetical protein
MQGPRVGAALEIARLALKTLRSLKEMNCKLFNK